MNEFDLECEVHTIREMMMGGGYTHNEQLDIELRSMFQSIRDGEIAGLEARLAEIKEEIKASPKKRCWTGGYSDRMSDRDYY